MAARVLLGRRAVMAASLVGGAFVPSVALAEAPQKPSFSRKPIYDDFEAHLPKTATAITPIPSTTSATIPDAEKPEPAAPAPSEPESKQQQLSELVGATSPRGPTPTDRLAVQIGRARMFLYHQVTAAEDAVNSAADRAFHLEKSFTSTIASLGPSRESGEQLMPGLVYVLVASMAGSVLTRNRNVLFRMAAPVALGIGAGWALLPVTMGNVSELAWTYEQRVPAVAQAHIQFRESLQSGVRFARVHANLGKSMVDEKMGDARETLEGWVKNGKQ